MSLIEVSTKPFNDQKPGTSGLRKRVTVFQQANYVENFTQAILNIQPKPKKLIIGGDGRYYNDVAIKRIVAVCIGNQIEHLYLAKDGILSTPAASALISSLKCDGAIVLTASHNPGGPKGDLGIKYNCKNGGPAPESFTKKVYGNSLEINSYKIISELSTELSLEHLKHFKIADSHIEIVDPIQNYLDLLKTIFDFDLLKSLFEPSVGLRILVDCMHGVMGPYARRIIIEELGAPETSVANHQPLPDFGGKHPDPNLTHAEVLSSSLQSDHSIKLGVAFDGDGDRHMILGTRGFFVTPGDSLAIVGNNLNLVKGYQEDGKIRGFARSFPTSPAIDRVAKNLKKSCYVTPTGWKFFGNLLDNGKITVCGEESFGVGGDHIREKDGMYSMLIWLTILAKTQSKVDDLIHDHWKKFGRDYFCRYDFEECDSEKSNLMMEQLEKTLESSELVGKEYPINDKRYLVQETGNFNYEDKHDGSITTKQGLYITFNNGAKIVFRLSGTGSAGSTIRVYVMDYDRCNIEIDAQVYLKPLFELALAISQLCKYVERDSPTVIT